MRRPCFHAGPAKHRTFRALAYHQSMRLWFAVFLLCLLPLRAWAGTAMGLQMAMEQAAANTGHPQHGLQTRNTEPQTSMPGDCPMQAQAAATLAVDAIGADDAGGLHCSGCDTCELCLATAALTAAPLQVTPHCYSTAHTAARCGFASADTTSCLKPPIS